MLGAGRAHSLMAGARLERERAGSNGHRVSENSTGLPRTPSRNVGAQGKAPPRDVTHLVPDLPGDGCCVLQAKPPLW